MGIFAAILFIFFSGPASARPLSGVSEIRWRWHISRWRAESFCGGISDKIDNIKTAVGIGTGVAAAGAIAGGTAVMLKDSAGAIGAFASGGLNAGAAAANFIGRSQLDDLIADMDECKRALGEIERERTELVLENPNDRSIREMDLILENCNGFNQGNILGIGKTLAASGIIAAIGAAAGIAGGIAAVKDSKAANVLSVGSGASAAASAVLSGITITGLEKNTGTAEKCGKAFAAGN
jgi:hypothetical protein